MSRATRPKKRRRPARSTRKLRSTGARQGAPRARAEQELQQAIRNHQDGNLAAAIAGYQRVLAFDPRNAAAYSNLGTALQSLGRLEDAVAAYRRALDIEANFPEAHSNLGNALKALGRIDEAAAAHRRALQIAPGYAAGHNNLGIALQAMGALEDAIQAYRQAINIQPNFAEAFNNLGDALQSLGRLDEAAAACRRALDIKPRFAAAYNNLGNALQAKGELENALASFRRAAEISPASAEIHNNIGATLKAMGRLVEAVAAYREAVEVNPAYAPAHNNLGNALQASSELDAADAAYRKALEINPKFAEAHGNLVLYMNYDPQFTAQDIYAESRRWDKTHAAPLNKAVQPHPNAPEPDRKLRLGYVSPDFRQHSVSHFIGPVISAHDRSAFEIFCYAEVPNPDHETAWFRERADGWRSTVGLVHEAVADRIREDQVDILVDLAGYSANNRLLAFAGRPAPVQVTWLGYPNTSGMAAMDYRLTDSVSDPEGPADALNCETVIRLPDAFLCYRPPADAPDTAPQPAEVNGFITLGSFNNLAKVTDEVVATWSEILRQVPHSRLLIKDKQMFEASSRERQIARFAAKGVDPARVLCAAHVPTTAAHLATYGQVDIALDPFPYNGGTTTCEAMWMGVPTITLRCDRPVGRMGASFLAQLDLRELVAESTAEYIELVVELSRDPDRLAALRRTLRQRMKASPLCDAGSFTRHLEAAYRDMWRRWCQSKASTA